MRQVLGRDATSEKLLTELGDDGTETALKQAADAGWIEREQSAYRATDMGQDALAPNEAPRKTYGSWDIGDGEQGVEVVDAVLAGERAVDLLADSEPVGRS